MPPEGRILLFDLSKYSLSVWANGGVVKVITSEVGGHEFDHQSGCYFFFSLCVGRTVDELSIKQNISPSTQKNFA
jgi:hypothetical protein